MNTARTAVAMLALALVAGCEDKAPAPAPKPAQAPAPAMPPPAMTPPAAITPGVVNVANLSFKVPDGWKQVPPANQVRIAELQVPDASGDPAKTSTAAFSVARGEPKANINRWATQVTDPSGQPSKPQVSERTVQGVKVTVVELTGSYTNAMANEPKRDNWTMRAAILELAPPDSLFIKMTGPADAMAASAPAFNAMIDGLTKR